MMTNKAMKQRHWNRIAETTEHPFDVESDSFSLRNIMEAPLLKHKEDIEVSTHIAFRSFIIINRTSERAWYVCLCVRQGGVPGCELVSVTGAVEFSMSYKQDAWRCGEYKKYSSIECKRAKECPLSPYIIAQAFLVVLARSSCMKVLK